MNSYLKKVLPRNKCKALIGTIPAKLIEIARLVHHVCIQALKY